MFRRGIGEGSDVVGKEMYEFEDRGGRTLALRPEGTAPMVRAFVQHRPPLPWKAWYATPAFRYERPQAGRYRQHHQLGVEALGPGRSRPRRRGGGAGRRLLPVRGPAGSTSSSTPWATGRAGPAYLELLRDYLASAGTRSAPSTAERLEANPLRVLDCKRPACRAATEGAPRLVDHLCDAVPAHFARVRDGLEALGVPYGLDHRLVRGFDYYTRTTFEFASGALESAQNGIGGGGRYDGLVEMLGGPPTPGIGFGIGIERLLLACDAEGVFAVDPARARRLRGRRGRGRRGPGHHRRAPPGRPAGRPGLRRPLDEVPAEVGRPFRGPGGAARRARRGWPRARCPSTPAGGRGAAHRARSPGWCEAVRAAAGAPGPVDRSGPPRPCRGPDRARTRKDPLMTATRRAVDATSMRTHLCGTLGTADVGATVHGVRLGGQAARAR